MIKARQYIQTGFSADDAEKLLSVMQPLIKKKEKVILDFSEIKIFTTLFFNNVLAKFLVEFGPDRYNEMFEVNNLSDVGKNTYQHSIENAKEYYKMSHEQREAQENITADLDDD